jgi:hypothetical protein
MDRHGNFYVSLQHEAGRFHHSSFLHAAPVAAAGELDVQNGILRVLSDQSGHYLPTPTLTKQAVDALTKHGIDMTNVKVEMR